MQAAIATTGAEPCTMLSIAPYDGGAHAFFVAKRQSKDPERVRRLQELGRRIDEIATRKSITTTAIQKAAGVTFAAAARWRKGEAWPELHHLRAIARVCGVTLDELVGPDGYEPPYEAWLLFLETPTGSSLTAAERRWFAIQWFPDDEEPTLATYLTLAEARKTTKKAG